MVDFAKHTARAINRLGSPVTVTPSGQSARVVNAVFTSTPADSFGLVSGSNLVLRAIASECEGLVAGDTVTRNGQSYKIVLVTNDAADSGDALITLEAV